MGETDHTTGVPKGVLSIMHGGVDAVNFICDEPLIKAITFVGSDRAGKHIYDRGGANGKRVQSNMGAKSMSQLSFSRRQTDGETDHGVLMPDANKNFALNSLAGAAFGGACEPRVKACS